MTGSTSLRWHRLIDASHFDFWGRLREFEYQSFRYSIFFVQELTTVSSYDISTRTSLHYIIIRTFGKYSAFVDNKNVKRET